ncbi:MAG TPA: MaoC family dehydratase N-terminal domain-containing protein [Rhizomicrobium sp.]
MSDDLQRWIGRSETVEDIASPVPLAGMAALLDHDAPPWREGDLPLLAHWLYFLGHARQSDIDIDGHPPRGGFLPPITLPRRMWAGSRIEFRGPVPVGAPITRHSTIADVKTKRGTSGTMIFVTVKHEIAVADRVAIAEEQDIVFREAAIAGAKPSTPKLDERAATKKRKVHPDSTLLFRFSALTFNAHRIHYDRDYCVDVEGYPGLVVQGPLTAMLLMDHFLRGHPRNNVTRFEFRAQSPLFDTAPFDLCADGNALWARGPHGETAMSARIETR